MILKIKNFIYKCDIRISINFYIIFKIFSYKVHLHYKIIIWDNRVEHKK